MGPEIIFVVPYVVGFVAAATIGGTLALWLVWVGLRRWGPRSVRMSVGAFPRGAVFSALLCLSLPVGCVWACQPVPQPESARTVAIFDVPLRTAADHAEFLAIVRREAATGGLNLDVLSLAKPIGVEMPMITAVVRRGATGATEAYLWEVSGKVRISFSQGEDRVSAHRFRERVMRQVVQRWPGTLAVPVTVTGGIPLR